jgi:predicted TIM-barrel fold metal-dependent hydrolase
MVTTSPSARVSYRVVDADNHLYESRDALTRHLPKRYRSVIHYVEVEGRTKIVIDGFLSDYIPNPTFDVVAAPGTFAPYFAGNNPEGKTLREMAGEPMRTVPAFREPGARERLLDELGIDATLMFPTLASLVEENLRHDPEAIHAVIHALNEWMHEDWTFNYHGRIFATPIITLPVVDEAIKELDWVLERGARAVLIRPAPVPGFRGSRSLGLPEFDVFWARVQEAGILVCLHSSDSGYSRYVSDWEPAREYLPFQPSPFRVMALGHRDIEDTISALILHGAAVRHPDLKFAVVENGSHWVPRLADGFERVYRQMPQEFDEHPLETLRRNFFINPFWEDHVGELLRVVDDEHVLFGSDYPHPEGLADPLSFADHLGDLPEASVRKIMGLNLAGLLQLPV